MHTVGKKITIPEYISAHNPERTPRRVRQWIPNREWASSLEGRAVTKYCEAIIYDNPFSAWCRGDGILTVLGCIPSADLYLVADGSYATWYREDALKIPTDIACDAMLGDRLLGTITFSDGEKSTFCTTIQEGIQVGGTVPNSLGLSIELQEILYLIRNHENDL